MNAQTLAQDLLKQVVEMNVAITGRMFDDELLNPNEPRKLDPRFKRTLDFYSSLTDEQRNSFLVAMRQTYIDSVSEILGILDGSTTLNDWKGDWTLLFGEHKLNGMLQDYFLEAVELSE